MGLAVSRRDPCLPSHRVHRFLSHQLLGKEFREIHRALDLPAKWLGARHRQLYHTLPEAARIAKTISDDPDAIMAAFLHIHYDEMCTRDPQLRAMLEFMAFVWEKDRGYRRRPRSST